MKRYHVIYVTDTLYADLVKEMTTGNGILLDGAVTVQTLTVASNNKATVTDITLTDNANIATNEDMYFYIDSDNNSAAHVFTWNTNAAFQDSQFELMRLTEAGVLTLTGVFLGPDGAVGAPTFSFSNATNYGMWYDPATGGWLKFSRAGIEVMNLNNGGAQVFSSAGSCQLSAIGTSAVTSGVVSRLQMIGYDGAGTPAQNTYAAVEAHIDDNTAGSEDGHMELKVSVAGSSVTRVVVDGDGVTVTGTTETDGLAAAIVTKTAAYTATVNDHTILADVSSGAYSITLPATPTPVGRIYNVKKVDSSVNVVTLAGNGNNIDGAATQPLNAQYECLTVQWDGTVWWII